jgi:serine/threonine protein kinase
MLSKLFKELGFLQNTRNKRGFIGLWRNKKVYLKVGKSKDPLWRVWFARNVLFYKFLESGSFKIKRYIPKLLYSGETRKFSYLIFEHIEGGVLGKSEPTRFYFGGEEELEGVLEILRLWQEVSVERKNLFVNVDIDEIGDKLKNNFDNEWVTEKFLMDLGEKGKARLFKFKERFEKMRGVLEREGKYLVHRDFRPQNFVKSKDRIYLVDFDFLGTGGKVFDFLTFWGFLYKYDNLRGFFMDAFLDRFKLTKEEKEIFRLEKLYFLFLEASELYKKERDGVKVGKGVLEKWQKKTLGDLLKELENE